MNDSRKPVRTASSRRARAQPSPDSDSIPGQAPKCRGSCTRVDGLLRFLLPGLLVGWFAAWAASPARGHDRLRVLLSQETRLEVGATHLDLTVELTFHEAPSFAERRRMDTNRNGRVDPAEIRHYLRDLTPDLEDGFDLSTAGGTNASPTRLALTLLHNPELDLRENPVVGFATHVLRFRLFARTPSGLHAGDHLRLASRLWPHVPGSRTLQVAGRDGFVFEPVAPSAPASPGLPDGPSLPDSFRCVDAPHSSLAGGSPLPSFAPDSGSPCPP